MTVFEFKKLLDENIDNITFKMCEEDYFLYAERSEIIDRIEEEACSLFANNILNRVEFNMLCSDSGYYLHAGDEDSYGWLTGVIDIGDDKRIVFG